MSSRKTRGADGLTTLNDLKEMIEDFVAQRDWAQFHSPKNLAMAIGVEAGELMDLFRWHSETQSRKFMKDRKGRRAATEELADVVICALAFANRAGVDIATAVRSKVEKNAKKYPADKYKGRF